jgi:hypothetical protein
MFPMDSLEFQLERVGDCKVLFREKVVEDGYGALKYVIHYFEMRVPILT